MNGKHSCGRDIEDSPPPGQMDEGAERDMEREALDKTVNGKEPPHFAAAVDACTRTGQLPFFFSFSPLPPRQARAEGRLRPRSLQSALQMKTELSLIILVGCRCQHVHSCRVPGRPSHSQCFATGIRSKDQHTHAPTHTLRLGERERESSNERGSPDAWIRLHVKASRESRQVGSATPTPSVCMLAPRPFFPIAMSWIGSALHDRRKGDERENGSSGSEGVSGSQRNDKVSCQYVSRRCLRALLVVPPASIREERGPNNHQASSPSLEHQVHW